MRAVWELTTIGLRVWLAVTVALILYSVSDFMFQRGGNLAFFGQRLLASVCWPLAMLSKNGRTVLGIFKDS